MRYKKGLILICFIICLFSIVSVVACDINETAVANEDSELIQTNDNDCLVENNNILEKQDCFVNHDVVLWVYDVHCGN